MSALALYEPRAMVLAEFKDLFAGVESDSLRGLFDEYAAVRAKIEAVSAICGGEQYEGCVEFFLRGNCSDERGYSHVIADRVFRQDGALKALDAAFWKRALDLTDVYQVMPTVRRNEWDLGIQKLNTPDFDEPTVRATLSELLSSRQKFFAERVDGIFRSLSREHVTNCPQGFRQRMIIGYMHSGGYADHSRTGYLSDLRAVIAKFMGRNDPAWGAARGLVDIAFRHTGQWIEVDGGAFRLRVYKKGTAHLEINPDIAWRLNCVLHSLYPRAIAEENRKRPAVRDKAWKVIQRPLPFEVIELLVGLKRDARKMEQTDFELPYRFFDDSKKVAAEAVAVLKSLGGVVDRKDQWVHFEYDARDVLDETIASGCLPDRVTHQYYPSPPSVAECAVSMAGDAEPDAEWLEPQAGQGHIADLLKSRRLTCVEISPLHCAVLKARGHQPICMDFLEWAKQTTRQFDRIVMNPPFSEGRWKAHLNAAASLLRTGGRISCVLPAIATGRALLPHTFSAPEWSNVFCNEFDGCGVMVAVMAAQRTL